MFLERKTIQTDWDKEFESLNGESDSLNFPIASDQVDPEIQEFQLQHASLHKAVQDVVEAAEGEIRFFQRNQSQFICKYLISTQVGYV